MKPGGGIRLARLLHARTNDALEILLLSHRDLLRPVREHPPPAAKPSNEGPQVPNPRVCPPLPPHRTFAWERPQEVRRESSAEGGRILAEVLLRALIRTTTARRLSFEAAVGVGKCSLATLLH